MSACVRSSDARQRTPRSSSEARWRCRPRLAALSGLASLTETAYCTALHDPFGLRRGAAGGRTFRSGERVRGRGVEVHSLESAAGRELNGLRGLLVAFDEEAGRWPVGLAVGTKMVRSENLALLPEPAGADAILPHKEAATGAAGRFLQELMATGGVDPMLRLLASRRDMVDCAVVETVLENLANATAKGYKVKQQVLSRLLASVKEILASRRPEPENIALPPPALDASAASNGSTDEVERLLAATAAALQADTFAVCDNFALPEKVRELSAELGTYDEAFETAKIWVGKEAAGAQLSVPTVRSDRIMWVCGNHHTPVDDHLWDSAGLQPDSGLAHCRPEVVMTESTTGFPRLTALMRRMDDFVLRGLVPHVPRLEGLAERSDCMVSIYADGARFQKHVDNPNRDGRLLTTILYLNNGEPWGTKDGGELRIFPSAPGAPPANFEPLGGRLVLFWADKLAHEVLPSRRRRMALTYWWFDRAEREAKVKELAFSAGPAATSSEEETLAQDFIADMMGSTAKPLDLVARARSLPPRAQALEGLERLSEEDLERLRGSMGKMGLD
mmetsp:Transcript_165886/g.527431  ORF Transcript_165886/g.527431 Transcript_165886/m.527431 type:complete len:561 (-) Transcript_165886:318-2000(-)